MKGEYPGMVTAFDALAHLAQYRYHCARAKDRLRKCRPRWLVPLASSTLALRLPSRSEPYNATPIDMAGAYTALCQWRVYLKPWMLASVRISSGDIVADYSPDAKQAMDPRASYLTQSLLEGVMNYGIGSVVRGRGFSAPAAGKTGTEHDVWFAAYTSSLLCGLVGYDETTPTSRFQERMRLAPIWAEFMKRAIKLPQYSDAKSFSPPEGHYDRLHRIDRDTGQLSDHACTVHAVNVAFLDGTAPR